MAEGGCAGVLVSSSRGRDTRCLKTIPLVSTSPKSRSSPSKARGARCIIQLQEVSLVHHAPLLPEPLAAARVDEGEQASLASTLQSFRTRLANLEAEFLSAEEDAESLCSASTCSTAGGGGGGGGAGCSQAPAAPVHSTREIEAAVETLQSLRTRLLNLQAEITEAGDPNSRSSRVTTPDDGGSLCNGSSQCDISGQCNRSASPNDVFWNWSKQ